MIQYKDKGRRGLNAERQIKIQQNWCFEKRIIKEFSYPFKYGSHEMVVDRKLYLVYQK